MAASRSLPEEKGRDIMKRIFAVVTTMFFLCTLIACDTNKSEIAREEGAPVFAGYQPGDFSAIEELSKGFDPDDIENFHYADLTIYNSRIPGPTPYVLEGYFQIREQAWDSYMKPYEGKWIEVMASDYPGTAGMDTASYQWLFCPSWDTEHKAERIGGGYNICEETRTIFFQLTRD